MYCNEFLGQLGRQRVVYPYISFFSQNTGIFRMNINGKGSIVTQPDIAIAVLGVETENKDLKIAQNENAIKSTQILNTLRNMELAEKDIKTESYTISPQYDYVEGKQIFRGYRVVHTFKITIKNIQQVGAIVDAAVSSGANIVNNINFTLSNPEIYYNQALKLALKNAVNKAQSIEGSLGIVVNKTPISITEESEGQTPIVERALLAAPAATTPIREGQIEISASIKAIFAYCLRV